MSRKNNFGRAICVIFGIGQDDDADVLGGEAASVDFFPMRETSSDLYTPHASPDQVQKTAPAAPLEQEELVPVPVPDRPQTFLSKLSRKRQDSSLLQKVCWGLEPVEEYHIEPLTPSRSFDGTYLAAGTTFRGTLSTRGDVEIAGDFEGEIDARGKVTLRANVTSKISAARLVLEGCCLEGDVEVNGSVEVDEHSVIRGNIRAENMTCAGKVQGDLDIQDDLVLKGSAAIDGNIRADTISVSKGAKITGTVEMHSMRR